MNWYVAKLIFNILENDAESSSQFDEQLRMIQADDKGEAFSIARMLGKKEESEMANDGSTRVKWKFIDVVELTEIKELTNGMEIHSRVHEAEESKEYIKFAHYKSRTIQSIYAVQSLIF